MAKTDRNFVFLDREMYILDRLYIMVIYISFFKKYFFPQNTKVLTFSFTEKRRIAARSDQNSIFPRCEAHILDQLYIMPMYIKFNEFLKISNFGSKSKHVRAQFYQKIPVSGKNRLKLCISWSWRSYSGSVIHSVPLDKFLRILKILKFWLKIYRC
jgi:hypothetical protein